MGRPQGCQSLIVTTFRLPFTTHKEVKGNSDGNNYDADNVGNVGNVDNNYDADNVGNVDNVDNVGNDGDVGNDTMMVVLVVMMIRATRCINHISTFNQYS